MSTSHNALIDEVISTAQNNTADNLSALEERIVEILASTPEGTNPRPQIVQAYEQYAELSAQELNTVTDLSANTVAEQTAAGIGAGTSPEDEDAERIMLEDSKGTVRQSILQHAEIVAGVVAVAAVTGEAPTLTNQRVRGAISGVMMRTSNRDTSKLQTQLRRLRSNPNADTVEIRGLTQKIRANLPNVETRGALLDTVNNTVEKVTMNFNNTFTKSRAEREGVTKYVYDGTTDGRSRPWCAQLAGSELTKEEIEELWEEDWSGKEEGDPFVVAGGYNCRHYFEALE